MKEKQIKRKTIIKIIIVIFMISWIFLFIKSENNINITQLHDNSPRQMMGYIVKTKQNKVVVIDGGLKEDAANLEQHIRKFGGKVDSWFLTHPHMDHVEAFINIIENTDIQIDNIYVTLNDIEWYEKNEVDRIEEVQRFFNIIEDEKIKDKVKQVKLNQKIEIDNLKCEILGIKNPEIITNSINNSSMIIKMQVNNKSILFLADAGVENGEKLLKEQKEKLKSDIVQMAHHGQNGVNKDVYEQIKPKECLWPTPKWLWDNDPGTGYDTGTWKTVEVRNWMKELNVNKNYVEKDGDIKIRIW